MQSIKPDTHFQAVICPDITERWLLGKVESTGQVVLQEKFGSRQFFFSDLEGFALTHFTGSFSLEQVQALCEQHADQLSPDFVQGLLRKIAALEGMQATRSVPITTSEPGICLKPCVEWIEHPDGYWILRNPEDVAFLQVSDRDYQILQYLSCHSLEETERHFQLASHQLKALIQLLTVTGMLIGTHPVPPPRRKFTPMQLLFFRIPLFNPDRWLAQHIDKITWIWTKAFAWLLTAFLVASLVVGIAQQGKMVQFGQQLWEAQGALVLIPFALLCGFVVGLHELGHAFTLKRFGGIVPEIGLLIICFAPGCYTDTTDSYCLTRRWQRALVVGAGVLCQFVIWAIAFWLWALLESGTWLHTASFLLMSAALLTVLLNLNPLAKFDGYYLAVALTGINNLRARSFQFYGRLLRRRKPIERPQDRWVLALYAPLSLGYSLLVFGHLVFWVLHWTLINIPALAITLFGIWALYYYRPFVRVSSSSAMTASSNPSGHSTPENSSKTASAQSRPPSLPISKRSLILCSVLCSLGVLSLIPVPHSISGEAVVDSAPGSRQVVSAPEAATVQEIHVRLNERVEPGQMVATLVSQDLEQQIADLDRKLIEAVSEREIAKQQLQLMMSRQAELQVKADASTQKTLRLEQEVAQLGTALESPKILQLKQQQFERQQAIAGWQQQLKLVEAQLNREVPLIAEGALPLSRSDESKRQQIALTSQIATAQAQIQAIDHQILTARKEMRNEWQEQGQPEANLASATLSSSTQEIGINTALIQKWDRQIPLLQQEKERLLQRQQRLHLRATVSGVVTTADLDLLVNQKLPEGKDLMTIANTQSPTARVQLTQADVTQIRAGMPVTFRIQDAGLTGLNAKVIEIPPAVSPESSQQSQQKPVVDVRVRLETEGAPLTLGTKGYAHIRLESMPLYQKIGRELLKLIPIGRFV